MTGVNLYLNEVHMVLWRHAKKPSKEVEPIDIARRLSQSLVGKPLFEEHETPATPELGDMVRIGEKETEYRVIYVSPNGREVNLEFPGTNLTRNRVQVERTHSCGSRAAQTQKEPPKPRIDVEAVQRRYREDA